MVRTEDRKRGDYEEESTDKEAEISEAAFDLLDEDEDEGLGATVESEDDKGWG
jgi:hypothetical protein